MNQELQNYIKQMREQGYTDEQIREGLKKAGWNDEQVEAEITNTPNPNKSSKPRTEENTKSEPEKSPKKGLSKKMVTIIAGVVFILGAGGAFGALYTDMWNPSWDPFVENAKNIENDEKSFNDENQVKDEGETGDSVPDEEPLLSDEQEELAENKNFENKFFSFSYPGDWIVKDSTDSSSSPEELGLLIRTEDWNQGISITVRSSEQYIASPLEEDSNKVALRAAIENGDIESFIKESTFSCEDETLAFCRYTDYRGYFMLNNKNSYVMYGAPSEGPSVFKMLFVSNGYVIDIQSNSLDEIINGPISDVGDIFKEIEGSGTGVVINSFTIK